MAKAANFSGEEGENPLFAGRAARAWVPFNRLLTRLGPGQVGYGQLGRELAFAGGESCADYSDRVLFFFLFNSTLSSPKAEIFSAFCLVLL